jgi:hypothetical protein
MSTTPNTGVAGERSEPDYTPAIYGSLLVTTLVAILWQVELEPELIALSVVISVAVFWLTHVWSEIVNRRLHGPLQRAWAFEIGRRESTMLTAVIVPAAVLALPRLTGMDVDTAVAIALFVSIAQLFIWGLAVGRAARSSWLIAVAIALVDACLGLLIVVLKLAVLH